MHTLGLNYITLEDKRYTFLRNKYGMRRKDDTLESKQ